MTSLEWIIERYRKEVFEWGTLDCMLGPADYVQHRTGVDGASHIRGKYHDLKSCDRLTGFIRDPEGVFEGCVERVGLEKTKQPVRTSIGLVITTLTDRPLGAICVGDHWTIFGESGAIFERPKEIVCAWKVP